MIKQQYENYTKADHHVWQLLYARQIEKIGSVAYQNFARGLSFLNFNEHFIPVFDEINRHLFYFNGWQVYPVPGLIDNKMFFQECITGSSALQHGSAK